MCAVRVVRVVRVFCLYVFVCVCMQVRAEGWDGEGYFSYSRVFVVLANVTSRTAVLSLSSS